MDVPTSEVGYTAAMPRREDHEVHKDMWWHWTKKKVFHMNFATNYCKYLDRGCNGVLLTCRICISEQTNSEHFGWITQILIASPEYFDSAGTSSRTSKKKIVSPRRNVNKNPTRCNSLQSHLFYCKVTVHVSGVHRTHHQEY